VPAADHDDIECRIRLHAISLDYGGPGDEQT
jgi:hypothetical protein